MNLDEFKQTASGGLYWDDDAREWTSTEDVRAYLANVQLFGVLWYDHYLSMPKTALRIYVRDSQPTVNFEPAHVERVEAEWWRKAGWYLLGVPWLWIQRLRGGYADQG